VCVLRASMWDGSILFYTHNDHSFASAICMILLLFNILIQGTVTAIVVRNMATNTNIDAGTAADLRCCIAFSRECGLLAPSRTMRRVVQGLAHEYCPPVQSSGSYHGRAPLSARVPRRQRPRLLVPENSCLQHHELREHRYGAAALHPVWLHVVRDSTPHFPPATEWLEIRTVVALCWAGHHGDGLMPDNDSCRILPQRGDHTHRRRQAGLDQSATTRVVVCGTVCAARDCGSPLLWRVPVHRVHDRARRPDHQLRRARGEKPLISNRFARVFSHTPEFDRPVFYFRMLRVVASLS
jgi:hypothetical protein